MSITSSVVKYNKIASECPHSGEMRNITATSLPDIPIAKHWRTEPCFLPKRYELIGNKILDFEVRPDDIWVISFPKTGTTWTQEMVWLLCNDLDYTAATRSLRERFHYIEYESFYGPGLELEFPTISSINRAPSPRMLKSHLPIHLLPRQLWSVKPKIVYVTRNPKDAAISWHHHLKNIQGCKATLAESVDAFLKDQLLYTPFHSHVLNFWRMRNEEYVHFMIYEDMMANFKDELERMVRFLGKSYSNEQLHALEMHLSFDAMRMNQAVNFSGYLEAVRRSQDVSHDFLFMRKGMSGGFTSELSPETIAKFDEITKEKFIESDFKFPI